MPVRRPRALGAVGPGPMLVLVLVLVLVLSALVGGCRAEPDPRTVRAGAVVDASATAYVGAHPVVLMVPSGRMTVTVSDPVSTVSALDTADGDSLVARADTTLVGVTWTLDRGAYPDSVNHEVASPAVVLGSPQQVKLTLIAGTDRYLVPDVRAMTDTGDRPSNTVWMAIAAADVDNPDVPAADPASALSLELDYAGLLQTARVGNGQVAAGVAAPFYEPMPVERDAGCRLRGARDARCAVGYAQGYPYVDGVGWAPAGRTYLVLGVSADRVPGALTVDGRPEVGTLTDPLGATSSLQVFEVAAGAATHHLAGGVTGVLQGATT